MAVSFDEEMDILLGRSKGRASSREKVGGGGGQKPRRYLAGAPEVMVKITGWGHSLGGTAVTGTIHRSISAHAVYITRKGKLEAETSEGGIISSAEAMREYLARVYPKDPRAGMTRQRESMHVVLSMPAGTEPEAVRLAARDFLKNRYGGERPYLFVLHTDTDNPHVHAMVRSRGFENRKLHYEKGELQIMREEFADSLNAQGVFAEATPRVTRGVVEKAVLQKLLHMINPKDGRTPRMPRVVMQRMTEALAIEERPKPWIEAISKRQSEVRNDLAEEVIRLRETRKAGALQKADIIEGFLDKMPPPMTWEQKARDAAAQARSERGAELGA